MDEPAESREVKRQERARQARHWRRRTSRRWHLLRVARALLLGSLVLVLVIPVLILSTQWGREQLLQYALPQVVSVLPVELSVGAAQSPHWDHYRFEDITLRHEGRTLLELSYFEFEWRGLALLRRHLVIRQLQAGQLRLDANPAHWPQGSGEEEAAEPAQTESEGGLPEWLSDYRFRLRKLGIDSLHVSHPDLPQPIEGYLDLRRLNISRLGHNPRIWLDHFELYLNEGQHRIAGSYRKDGLDAEVRLNRFPLDILEGVSPVMNTGWLSARIDVYGDPRSPRARGEVETSSSLLDRPITAIARLGYEDFILDWKQLEASWGGLELLSQGQVDLQRQQLRAEVERADIPQSFVESWGVEIPADIRFEARAIRGVAEGPFDQIQYRSQVEASAQVRDLPLSLQAEISGDTQQLTIETAEIKALEAQIETEGTVEFEGRFDVAAELQSVGQTLLERLQVELPAPLADQLQFTLDGRVAAKGPFMAPSIDARLGATGRFRDEDFRLALNAEAGQEFATDLDLKLWTGEQRSTTELPDLQLSGQIQPQKQTLDLEGRFDRVSLALLRLADISLPSALTGELSGVLDASGPFTRPSVQSDLQLTGALRQQPYQLTVDGSFRDARLDIDTARLQLDGRKLAEVSGQASATRQTLELWVDGFDLSLLNRLGIDNPGGIVNLDLSALLDSSELKLDGEAAYTVVHEVEASDGKRVPTRYVASNQLSTENQQLRINTRLQQNDQPVSDLATRIAVPPLHQWILNLQSGKADSAPELDIDSQGRLDLSALQALIPERLDQFGGELNLDLKARGPANEPKLTGQIGMTDGFYENDMAGLAVRDVELEAKLLGDTVNIVRMTAVTPDEGSLGVTGRAQWTRPWPVDLELATRNARLVNRPDVEATVSGNLNFDGDVSGYELAGRLKLQPLSLNIDSSFSSGVSEIQVTSTDLPEAEEENLAELSIERYQRIIPAGGDSGEAAVETGVPVALDLEIVTEQEAFLRGRGLDAELSGQVNIDGTVANPKPSGHFEVIRGRLDLLGKRFELKTGRAEFTGTGVILNLQAEHQGENTLFKVSLTGTLDDFQLDLTSVPALPQDEVVSRLLFGKSVENISALQALRLATAVQSLQGGNSLIPDPLDTARNLVGVDELTVESEQTEQGQGVKVGVGKYLSDKVYVEIERSPEPDKPWQGKLDVELTPRLNLRTTTSGGTGEGGVELLWSKDY